MPEGELIGFNSFVENSTRATDPSYSNNNINEFQVYGTVNGVNIYNGNKVSRGDKQYNVAWTCEGNQQYWIDGAHYVFAGIVDGNKANVSTTATDTKGMPTSIVYTADGATDLLCQTIDYTAGATNGLVKFNFTHLLSKVNFTVVNGAADAKDYIFVVRNITFTGAKKGTYTIAYPTAAGTLVSGSWTIAEGDKGATNLSNLTVNTTTTTAELATEMLFIPGSYVVDFAVDIYHKEVKEGNLVTTLDYAGSTQALAANSAYNFKVNVSLGSPIQFTVEKQPTWEDGDGADDTTLTL